VKCLNINGFGISLASHNNCKCPSIQILRSLAAAFQKHCVRNYLANIWW